MEQVKDLFGYLSVKDVEVKETHVEPQQVNNVASVVWKL